MDIIRILKITQLETVQYSLQIDCFFFKIKSFFFLLKENKNLWETCFKIFLMRYLADNPHWLWLWDKYGIATQTFQKIYVITKIKQSMTNKLFFNSLHRKLKHQEAKLEC